MTLYLVFWNYEDFGEHSRLSLITTDKEKADKRAKELTDKRFADTCESLSNIGLTPSSVNDDGNWSEIFTLETEEENFSVDF